MSQKTVRSSHIDTLRHLKRFSLFVSLFTLIFAFFYLSWLGLRYWQRQRASVIWTQIPVCSPEQQADAHLLQFPDQTFILIDAGNGNGNLVPFLQQKGVQKLAKILISHPHKDHYDGLEPILLSGIEVEEVRFAAPDKDECDLEIPWGCDYRHVLDTIALIQKHSIPVRTQKAGDIYFDKEGAKLEVLYAFTEKTVPGGPRGINDLSVILRLNYKGTTALFTGDLNLHLSDHLATHHPETLSANILKVPHHGTESLASNRFFDTVGAKAALVPSPKKLWKSPRSERVRDYFQKAQTPVYVDGVDGQVSVLFFDSGYTIQKNGLFSKFF